MTTRLKHQDARRVDEWGLAACPKRSLQKIADGLGACKDENPDIGLEKFVCVGAEEEYHLETG